MALHVDAWLPLVNCPLVLHLDCASYSMSWDGEPTACLLSQGPNRSHRLGSAHSRQELPYNLEDGVQVPDILEGAPQRLLCGPQMPFLLYVSSMPSQSLLLRL